VNASSEHRRSWLQILHSTEPADRCRAEPGLSALYVAAGFPVPAHVLWFGSPCTASWALAALVPTDDISGQLLAPNVLTKDEQNRLERARAELRDSVGAGRAEAHLWGAKRRELPSPSALSPGERPSVIRSASEPDVPVGRRSVRRQPELPRNRGNGTSENPGCAGPLPPAEPGSTLDITRAFQQSRSTFGSAQSRRLHRTPANPVPRARRDNAQ
jgi:hypothetical protein